MCDLCVLHLPGYLLHTSTSIEKEYEKRMKDGIWFLFRSQERNKENLFAISWFHVVLLLNLWVNPLFFFNLLTLAQQVLPKTHAINCSYSAKGEQKSINRRNITGWQTFRFLSKSYMQFAKPLNYLQLYCSPVGPFSQTIFPSNYHSNYDKHMNYSYFSMEKRRTFKVKKKKKKKKEYTKIYKRASEENNTHAQ